MKMFHLILLLVALLSGSYVISQDKSLDEMVAQTDMAALLYKAEDIIVRGFDGQNPPPRLTAPTRNLFYGYGMTAYHLSLDSLFFFNILSLDAIHRSGNGAIIKSFSQKGGRYTEPFKNYFIHEIKSSEKKNIYFENIYVKDKKGNHLKLPEPQPFCPHCP